MIRNASLWAFLVLFLAPTALGQVLGRVEGRQLTGTGGYYINALENEPTIRVTVLGDVPRIGIYDLGRGFDDLQSLMSLAGGPTATAVGTGTDLELRDPGVAVRLIRGSSAFYAGTYESLVDDQEIQLQDGDQVQVETVFARGVYVWGAVGRPGYYEVGSEVDALRLLALAGGPQGDGARAEDVVNDATIAVLRRGEGIVYQSSLEDFYRATSLPPLADGDALQVEVVTRNRFTLLNALTVVGSVSALVLTVLRLVDVATN